MPIISHTSLWDHQSQQTCDGGKPRYTSGIDTNKPQPAARIGANGNAHLVRSFRGRCNKRKYYTR